MSEKKDVIRCGKCGKIISDNRFGEADIYRHMSVKWCDTCRPKVINEQTAERMKRYRKRKKIANKLRDQQLKLLEEENLLLKQNITKLREMLYS